MRIVNCQIELKKTHIVMRYEPIQDIQQPRGATEKVRHITTNFVSDRMTR